MFSVHSNAAPRSSGPAGAPYALDDAPFGQAHESAVSDHEVIVDAEIQQVGAFDELPCQSDVLTAWRGITARMIVEQNHRGGRLENRRLEHLPRVYEARRQRPLGDHSVAQEAVLRIEERDAKHLAL